MQQCGGKCREGHDAEQDEGGAGHEEFVERVGRVDRRVRDGGARGGEDARDMCVVGGDNAAGDLAASGPLARRDQRRGEQAAEEDAHAGPDQAGFDRD